MTIGLWARDFYEVIVDEAAKAESTVTSKKSRANNLIVLVEFLLKFTSNNGFQLFLDVLLNFTSEKDRSDWIAI